MCPLLPRHLIFVFLGCKKINMKWKIVSCRRKGFPLRLKSTLLVPKCLLHATWENGGVLERNKDSCTICFWDKLIDRYCSSAFKIYSKQWHKPQATCIEKLKNTPCQIKLQKHHPEWTSTLQSSSSLQMWNRMQPWTRY